MTRPIAWVVPLVVAITTWVSPALAQREEEARALFTAGEVAYADGRFEDALGHFQMAYDISSRAELLYNIGLANANLGRNREALAAFERYLADRPDAPNRGVVEGRVQALRAQVAESDAEQRRIDEAQARTRAQRQREEDELAASRSGARTTGWILTIGGGAILAGGVVMFLIGNSDVSTVEDAEDGTAWLDLEGANDRAPLFTGIGIAAAGAGLIATAIGVVLIASSGSGGTETRVTLGPGGASVTGAF